MDDNFFPAFRPKNWQDTTDLRKMRDYSRPMDPEPQTREGDGLIVHSCDEYWHYRFDLMMDAELALSNFLELLVNTIKPGYWRRFCWVFATSSK